MEAEVEEDLLGDGAAERGSAGANGGRGGRGPAAWRACTRICLAREYYVASPLIMECDNAMVVQELKDERSSKSAISGIIGDIKNLMSFFIDQNVCKINRESSDLALVGGGAATSPALQMDDDLQLSGKRLVMSHLWMYGNRCAPAFREGVNSFLLVAEANKSKQGFMCCPCLKCKNEKDYSCSRDIKSHLLRFGFMSSYNVWTKHGEEGVIMEDGDEEEDNDEQYRSMFSEYDDTAMDGNEEEGGEEQASDDPVDDDLRRAISDARRDCGTDKERLQFDKMLEDHHKLLYPGCEDGHRKLGSILELLKWKAEVGVTDSGFEKLMIILKKMFPRNNELPVSTYEAKKLVCPLGLDVQKIHACINDCILYRSPICGALRYKIRKDDPGDVEGETPRKRVPAKVMWYAPIIPRLKRLFRNKEHAKLLRWHMEECKKDAMLRHPADGRQWRNIGREFPDFAAEESPGHPDYSPTWDSFFINRRERAATRRTARLLRTSTRPAVGCGGAAGLSSVMAYRGPRLRYPQSKPTRAHPLRLDNRDPDASDDDVGDYDDYSGDYYRARHDYD
ncbi:hypothetical protein QYE76_067848 [Lolium multiflorum]|uniref:Transposase-associated domain-containing protein n=1 Tax=Lolium multiflorum TaxID=4521 RepID=A0AAD8WBC7_LOLMU|nr:hypothetical protein QYE76_067848 [Lolium multiflorum]